MGEVAFLTKSHLHVPEAVDKLIGVTRRIVKKQEYVATLAVNSSASKETLWKISDAIHTLLLEK